MSDKFFPSKLGDILRRIKIEKKDGSIFGISDQFFFNPVGKEKLRKIFFGNTIATSYGPAAGPSTQLCQNIVSSWLTGARFIELKTVQVLDEIDVKKPCIEMEDVGFNCEWSQELTVDQAFGEYLKAWILVHYLNSELFGKKESELETVFNMSIGYNLKGIKSPKVQGFIERMRDCRREKKRLLEELPSEYAQISDLNIPDCISDSVTISTMHGTPPDEIEAIGQYFLSELQMNIMIKLNPTLLGKERVRSILNKESKFSLEVPDSAFAHDPSFENIVEIIRNLKLSAKKNGLYFGVKLTNTLEVLNETISLPPKEKNVYMSGRALYPITFETARKLKETFNGDLEISFSGGADALNLPELVEEGLYPVTVASDILKPGGYTRFFQYADALMNGKQNKKINKDDESDRYKYDLLKNFKGKGKRELSLFDCIYPSCMEGCAASQDIPGYLKLTTERKTDDALGLVRETNPMPSVTGNICDHKCQDRCVRNYYDEPVRIREIKKFLSKNGISSDKKRVDDSVNDFKVVVVGAGPGGLSCAHSLSKLGVSVTVFEKSRKKGGMIESVIPEFRLGKDALASDLEELDLGKTRFMFGKLIDNTALKKLSDEYDYVFFSAGAQTPVKLQIEGMGSEGVFSPLEILKKIKAGIQVDIGNSVAVIGGGNTAVDIARSINRMKEANARVTLIYRRTVKEMPAGSEEIKDALREGVDILELTSPEAIVTEDGKATGIRCSKNKLRGKGLDGRSLPVKIEGSEFIFKCDTIIPALGQRAEKDNFDLEPVEKEGSGNLLFSGNIIFGGDCGKGDKTVINALADGRFAALYILGMKEKFSEKKAGIVKTSQEELMLKRAVRKYSGISSKSTKMISIEEAVREAARCLQCDEICDICVTVCPNRANISYKTEIGSYNIPVIDENSDNIITKIFRLEQENQVAHVTDYCNHCGNCTTFCPRSGNPYEDKPRLALSDASFQNDDNLFLISKKSGFRLITRKRGDKIETLGLKQDKLIYNDGKINLTLKSDTLAPEAVDLSGSRLRLIDDESLFSMIVLIRHLPEYLFLD